jgi:hypothetical protein
VILSFLFSLDLLTLIRRLTAERRSKVGSVTRSLARPLEALKSRLLLCLKQYGADLKNSRLAAMDIDGIGHRNTLEYQKGVR